MIFRKVPRQDKKSNLNLMIFEWIEHLEWIVDYLLSANRSCWCRRIHQSIESSEAGGSYWKENESDEMREMDIFSLSHRDIQHRCLNRNWLVWALMDRLIFLNIDNLLDIDLDQHDQPWRNSRFLSEKRIHASCDIFARYQWRSQLVNNKMREIVNTEREQWSCVVFPHVLMVIQPVVKR